MLKKKCQTNKELPSALITSIAPYFLEKENSWLQENQKMILGALKTQPFWQDNVLFLEKDQKVGISETLKKIDELGYEKVFKVRGPGEFANTGGIIEIFPINLNCAVRLDFLGNRLESIERLPLEIIDEKTAKHLLKKRLKSQAVFSDIKNIKPGDYLVHLDHGIGRFQEKKEITGQGSKKKEYYILEYAQGDKLYVPLGLERKLSRYVGFHEPKISRLGSILWQKTKCLIKEEAEKFAQELLELLAEKEMAQRSPYYQQDFAEALDNTFAFNLTPDQKQVLTEIASDLESVKPMDRIVCGDVGFGKTEIALRAAVRVAENGQQVAIICPTTILAAQHFQNFQKRLPQIPLKVASLSRLQSASERRKTVEAIIKGTVDIVIGTHSLLAKRVSFKKLGLLIIDDEQRFGVKQKEKLRQQNPALDVLYLSATPIPRTLYLALSSLKEISFIQTPPKGRKSIKTFVLPLKKETIKKAIQEELKRSGQIYFLHNRISTIFAFKKLLEELDTGAVIGVLHAKLKETEIIKIMADFQQGKINLLLSTTIIENGLDIANANTLIVDDSTRLGLAQAYQLRGRIGRSDHQSYAYFLYPKGQLKGLAKRRLHALKEAEELGSGYKIAVQDLEIRGAGNILGKEQSGSVNKVGLNLYCQMLSEAVEKLKATKKS